MKILLFAITLFAQNAVEVEGEQERDVDVAKISEAMGHLIGKNLEHLGLNFDVNLVLKGIKDATSGKKSPMSEEECVQAISIIQEHAYNEEAEKNLTDAEEYLKRKEKGKGINKLERGKLLYSVEKQGEGEEVQGYHSPLIRYTGKYLDGTVFGHSQEEELISLDETIPGFSKGIVGMKEGEVRTIYIHPDLGYGKKGVLSPNSLLTFEIEVIKADGACQASEPDLLQVIRQGDVPIDPLLEKELAR